ncbi:MAG: hypothetical protein EOP04_00710 [Proteobacteria bacterium]|nr:MAG: hypothetical protein EOP04_00710 [Pseudomonadota bacterium]
MKILFALFFFASPAFGHQILFNNPEFLNLADGDPIAGHELYTFCAAAGKDFSSCKLLLTGDGKNKLLAARFCVQRYMSPKDLKVLSRGKNYGLEVFEKKFIYGKVWHEDFQDSSEGRHMHGYSDYSLNDSTQGYFSRLIQDKVSQNHARAYISDRYHFTDPRLSKVEMASLKIESERAKSFPYIEHTPDIVCEDEKKCRSGAGSIAWDKVLKSATPTPGKGPSYAEECLKDELVMLKTGLRGIIRD